MTVREPGPIVMYTPTGKLVRHGSLVAYNKHCCRCQECREANAAYNRKRRRERDPSTGEFKHGSSGYANWSCRCDVCTQAWAAKNKRNKDNRLKRLEDAPHGTQSGYNSWGCRCALCSDAHNHYKRDRQLKDR